jgi:hypothetical protein
MIMIRFDDESLIIIFAASDDWFSVGGSGKLTNKVIKHKSIANENFGLYKQCSGHNHKSQIC